MPDSDDSDQPLFKKIDTVSPAVTRRLDGGRNQQQELSAKKTVTFNLDAVEAYSADTFGSESSQESQLAKKSIHQSRPQTSANNNQIEEEGTMVYTLESNSNMSTMKAADRTATLPNDATLPYDCTSDDAKVISDIAYKNVKDEIRDEGVSTINKVSTLDFDYNQETVPYDIHVDADKLPLVNKSSDNDTKYDQETLCYDMEVDSNKNNDKAKESHYYQDTVPYEVSDNNEIEKDNKVDAIQVDQDQTLAYTHDG